MTKELVIWIGLYGILYNYACVFFRTIDLLIIYCTVLRICDTNEVKAIWWIYFTEKLCKLPYHCGVIFGS